LRFGESVLRVEDRPLLTGASRFVDDIALPGMLHAAFARSPLARARIRAIHLGAARALPGVAGAFAGIDLALPPLVTPLDVPTAFNPPRPVLPENAAKFVGEPLAVVVARSRYEAEDAADLIEFELEPLDAVVDAKDAVEANSAAVHDGAANVYSEARVESGDVDAAFGGAAVTIAAEFRHQRVLPLPIETRGIVAAPDGEGVHVWASSQGAHNLRAVIAELLGLAEDAVRVECTDVGGGFGVKAHVYPEDVVVAWLACRLAAPVKWIEDRREHMLAANQARGQHLSVRAAAESDGTLLALEVDQIVDQGAYGNYPHGIALEANTTTALLPGPYRLPALRVRSRSAATNKAPQGAYRGVGFTAAVWVHERVMDMLAAELGMDPAELRRRNLRRPDELDAPTATNQRYGTGDYARALELALEKVGYAGFEEERGRSERMLGLGLACYVEPTGMGTQVFRARGMTAVNGTDSVHVALDERGRATVWTTTPAIGQGVDTTFAQATADALALPLEDVVVARTDTSVGELVGTGSFASRSAVAAGGALAGAGVEMRRRLLEDAAQRLEAAEADLELVDGGVRVVGSASSWIGYGELVAGADANRYAVSEQYDPTTEYPYSTHACVVAIDPETGAVEVLRYVVVSDCGRQINPMIVEGQAHGAVAQGIGEALYEAVAYDERGEVLTGSLADYLVPTAAEIPRIDVSHFEIASPQHPWGVRGTGESGTVGAVAAVANAVADAVGVPLNELPLTPELVASVSGRHSARSPRITRRP
jgi:carbon-monoxide dehydrogenase large subunit